MKKEIIYSDLDGTLFHLDDNNVSTFREETVEIINEWVNNGKLFSFATGRNIISIKPFLENYNIKFNLPLVLSNGTVVYDYHNDKILYKETLNKDVILEAYDFSQKNSNLVRLSLFAPDKEYLITDKKDEDLSGFEMNFITKHFHEIDFTEITKAIFIVDPNRDNSDVREMMKDFKTINHFDIIPSGYKYIELINKGTTKYTSIQKALEHNNINNYNLYTIGDFINDYDMVKYAHIGFAPENALNEVKDVADHVVSHHNENAIVDMITILKNK